MKSERRHELRENDLQHVLELTRDYLAEKGSRLGIIVLGVIVLIVVVNVAMRSSATTIEDAWAKKAALQYDTLEKGLVALDSLQSIGEGTSDRDLALACLIDRGNQALALGQKVADPPDRKLNEIARTAFETLRDRHRDNPLALSIALGGLASVEENAFALDGKLEHKDKARAYLTELVENKELNGLPLQQVAIDRRKNLDSTFVKVKLSYPPPPSPQSATEAEEGSDPADPVVPPTAP